MLPFNSFSLIDKDCMLKKILVSVFAVMLSMSSISNAQTTLMDSLKNNIAKANNETNKLSAVMHLCDNWESCNKDTMQHYALIVEKMATNQNNTIAKLYAQYYMAVYLLEENKLDTALRKTNELIAIAKKTLPYGDIYLRLYRLKGNILSRGNQANELARNSFELLKLAEDNNDTTGMISAKTSIGNANLKMEKFQDAIQWQRQALKLMNNPFYKRKMCIVYLNMAAPFNDGIKNFDSAEYYMKLCIQYAYESGNLVNENKAENVYGSVLSRLGRINEAEAAFQKAVQLEKQIGDSYYIAAGVNMLGEFYANIRACLKL